MVKYKVNIKFKEDGKSLNNTLIEVLKIEINKKINYINIHHFQGKDNI